MSTQREERLVQLLAIRDDVLACWLTRVRADIPYAASMPLPALVNTLPTFYDHLATITCDAGHAFDHSSIAAEHGGQRARVTRFNAGLIVYEFQLFRAAIFDTWHAAGITLELDEVARLGSAIDVALRESLISFSLAETDIREQFFSALTHDLRTPLAAAATAVDIIHKSGDLARIRKLAALARRQHVILEDMIGDLLDMMAHTADAALPELGDTEMHGLVSEAVASVALSSGREIVLTGEPVHGKWGAEAIRRAVENLLNNAVKYSDKDTAIEVGVKTVEGHVLVEVTNTGPPIPAEQTEAIFQLFRRSKREQDRGITGWGIGLPYVRSVAEQHGGSVAVTSGESTTTFLFDVPQNPQQVLNRVPLRR